MRRPLLAFLPAACAATGALALLLPAGEAFSVTGWTLASDATHVRVFNNFLDASANDHTTPHDQFPGAVGAPLAIWKASVEWGTTLHGNGEGDPTQPGDLGSGGSNWSPSWQGAASGVGAIGDNIHSTISSAGLGVIAYTETGNGGWRIRYNEAFVWDDDPVAPTGLGIDLQTIATHEYGHALGLGHTSVSGCVMSAAAVGVGVMRDLCPDDQAGIQFLYGAAGPAKPSISKVLVDAAGVVTIQGENFAPFANEVWFTKADPAGVGPVKITGVVATGGGTEIVVSFPAAAGPGDVLVNTSGASLSGLSNAWPIDTPGGVSCGTTTYGVGLGGANIATLDTVSSPAVGTTMSLDLAGVPSDVPVLVLIGASDASLPLFGGTVLIDPATLISTHPGLASGGLASVDVAIPATPSIAGAAVYAQGGAADPLGPAGFVLTNGLAIVVCP